jgi:DNA-binding transcriptional ArsR family regulator
MAEEATKKAYQKVPDPLPRLRVLVLKAMAEHALKEGVTPCCGELAEQLGVSLGVVTYHCRRLARAGWLVKVKYGWELAGLVKRFAFAEDLSGERLRAALVYAKKLEECPV